MGITSSNQDVSIHNNSTKLISLSGHQTIIEYLKPGNVKYLTEEEAEYLSIELGKFGENCIEKDMILSDGTNTTISVSTNPSIGFYELKENKISHLGNEVSVNMSYENDEIKVIIYDT